MKIDNELKSILCNFFSINYNEFKYDGLDRINIVGDQFMKFSDSKTSIGIIEKIKGLFEVTEVRKNDANEWKFLISKGVIQFRIDEENTEVVKYYVHHYPEILTLEGKQFDFTTELVAMRLEEG